MNMDNRRRNPSHYNNRHRKKRKRKISPLEYPSMLVKWMIKNKAMSAVLGVLLAVVIGTIILVSWGMSKGKTAVSYTHLDVYKRQRIDLPGLRTGREQECRL